MRKKIKILMAFLLVGSIIPEYMIQEAEAYSSKTVILDKGEISKTMNWENPKWVDYPNSSYGNYPATYHYNQDGYEGTLYATRIKLTPLEKEYHKDPVYRTETKTFNKTHTITRDTADNNHFYSSLYVNEDGYTGNIPRTSGSWTANWVRNRSTTLTRYWTDSTYREFSSEVPEPSTFKDTYYDSPSGKNVSFSLPKSGGLQSVASKEGWIDYISRGRASNYDRDTNYYLGFMSNNTSTYHWGSFSDSKPDWAESTDKYYGIPRSYIGMGDWQVVDIGWDESLQDAKNWQNVAVYSGGTWYWRSEGGSMNRYRRGVWIHYRLKVPLKQYRQGYRGTISLPDYIEDYTGTANYSGTLSKQVLDHYNEYYTSDRWKVEVEYEGDIYSRNLKADYIKIFDNGVEPSHLVKGNTYEVRIKYRNVGELDISSHNVGFYEDGTLKQQKRISSIKEGDYELVTFNYTPNKSGNVSLSAFVDKDDEIEEAYENDNKRDNSIYVNTKPTVSLTYSPSEVYEGDPLALKMSVYDSDRDSLKVTLEMKKNNHPWEKVYEKSNVASGSNLIHNISSVDDVPYQFKVTVEDSYGEKDTDTVNFVVKPLIIQGEVNHTDNWKVYHEQQGNPLEFFYSGEKFLPKAIVTDHPIKNVKVEFKGIQVDDVELNIEKDLLSNHPIYTGEIYQPQMSAPKTKLARGNVSFLFTAEWENGTIKKDLITVQIIDDVYQAYDFYRTN